LHSKRSLCSSSTNESLKRPLEVDDGEEEHPAQPPPSASLPRLLVPGGRLPGIGAAEGFSDSSDSNESSDDDGVSRHASLAGVQTSLAQRKKLMKQLQDIVTSSSGGCE
jgi:hypothetical protein